MGVWGLDGVWRKVGCLEFYDEGNRTHKITLVSGAATGATTVFEWDHRNRLVEVREYASLSDAEANSGAGQDTTQVVRHAYDAYNQWTGKLVDTDGDAGSAAVEATFYLYDQGQIVLEYFEDNVGTDIDDPSGVGIQDLEDRYLWGDRVDQLLAHEALKKSSSNPNVTDFTLEGDVDWPLLDHQNSIRDVAEYDTATNTTTLTSHIVYDSFGNVVLNEDGSQTALSEAELIFGYTGRIFEAETGLQNNLHRWYDASVGRWISEDPIGFAAGDANLARYVGNSGTIYVDPNGLVIKGVGSLGGHFTKYLDEEFNIIPDKDTNPRDYTRALILKSMIECEDVFVLKGDTIEENVANLVKHVEARRTILRNTWKKRFRFGAGRDFKVKHTISPIPDRRTDPQKYFESINNEESAIACTAATSLMMDTGSNSSGNLVRRSVKSSEDLVPGDWGYIYNDAHQVYKPGYEGREAAFDSAPGAFNDGLEGENLIFAGEGIFWGHFGPGNTYLSAHEWMADINEWMSKDGSTSGKARVNKAVDSPMVGLERIDDK